MRALPPLEEIGFGWRSHGAALRWWGLFLTRPRRFETAVAALAGAARRRVFAALLIHVAPWFAGLVTIGRWLPLNPLPSAIGLGGLLGGVASGASSLGAGNWGSTATRRRLTQFLGLLSLALVLCHDQSHSQVDQALLNLALGFAISLALGFGKDLTGGLAVGFGGLAGGLAGGLTFGPAFALGIGFAFGFGFGLAGGLVGGSGFGLVLGSVLGFGTGLDTGLAGGIVFGLAVSFGFFLALGRVPYLLVHLPLVFPNPRGRLYPRHPVAWDDCCHLPFLGLHRLLVAYHAIDPAAGDREIDRLIDEYPAQRKQAILAKETIVARRACMLVRLTEIDDVLVSLPERPGKRGDETRRIKALAHEVTEAAARLETASRAFLREPYSEVLVTAIDRFHDQVAGVRAPLGPELRAAARRWKAIAEVGRGELREQASRELVRQVFRAGDPVDRVQEAFVPRLGPIGEVEAQIVLATGCPGLVVYGRRRTGKTTLLRNLSSFVGQGVSVGYVSVLGARTSSGIDGFTEVAHQQLQAAISALEPPKDRSLVGFEQLLATADRLFAEAGRRFVLAIDEYENIDRKIGEGVFDEDFLAMIRESIQSHRRIIWCFAGSHAVEELEHADWSSYLVSARTIELPFFSPEETRLLLTEPLRTSPLWQPGDPARPRFAPSFWGEGGIERIHVQTAGWPHLVQLLAENTVDLVNETSAAAVDPALLDKAADRAVERGHLVFRQLLEKECRVPAEWDYLYAFRRQETQPPPHDPAIERSLRRRLLVSEEGDLWRLRVPLMARWLRMRA